MSPAERQAWERFHEWCRRAAVELDGMVPVALICLPATPTADGALDVEITRGGAVLWPKDVPVAERGPLLEALAAPYRDGTVRRR